ncbi:MAG TPA: hypothetical protein VGK63_11930, partial [Candidatus Limnocylindrales bacterium]
GSVTDDVRLAAVRRLRDEHGLDGLDRPFDVVLDGTSPADPRAAAELLGRCEDAGVTWWIEADWSNTSVERLRDRIVAGPPRPVAAATPR